MGKYVKLVESCNEEVLEEGINKDAVAKAVKAGHDKKFINKLIKNVKTVAKFKGKGVYFDPNDGVFINRYDDELTKDSLLIFKESTEELSEGRMKATKEQQDFVEGLFKANKKITKKVVQDNWDSYKKQGFSDTRFVFDVWYGVVQKKWHEKYGYNDGITNDDQLGVLMRHTIKKLYGINIPKLKDR